MDTEEKNKRLIIDQSITAGKVVESAEELIITIGVVFDNSLEDTNGGYSILSAKEYGISTWKEAEELCHEWDGHLAVINSEYENILLYALMLQDGIYSAYIGYSDYENEGEWKWYDGVSSCTNWNANEPDGENDREDYAMIDSKSKEGSWSDGDFTESDKFFICEYNPS